MYLSSSPGLFLFFLSNFSLHIFSLSFYCSPAHIFFISILNSLTSLSLFHFVVFLSVYSILYISLFLLHSLILFITYVSLLESLWNIFLFVSLSFLNIHIKWLYIRMYVCIRRKKVANFRSRVPFIYKSFQSKMYCLKSVLSVCLSKVSTCEYKIQG